jgi:hypothetical protein
LVGCQKKGVVLSTFRRRLSPDLITECDMLRYEAQVTYDTE